MDSFSVSGKVGCIPQTTGTGKQGLRITGNRRVNDRYVKTEIDHLNIKTMKENELIQLRKTLLNDLLKIRTLLKKRIHTELENNTTSYTETDYTINRLITIDEKIEEEISKRLRSIELKRMYKY
jgi:hypothetical protein